MIKVNRGNIASKRRKKILKLTKGFKGAHSRLYRVAKTQAIKKLLYAYTGRKQVKRNFRSLWISRINAEVEKENLNYNTFIQLIKKANIRLNLKMISKLISMEKNIILNLIK